MFQRRLLTLHVPRHQPVNVGVRRDLISDVLHDAARCRCPIRQKSAQEPHRAQLHRKPHTVVITTVTALPDSIIQEEEPLQLSPGRISVELGIHRRLVVAEELHRHKMNLVHDRPAPALPPEQCLRPVDLPGRTYLPDRPK